MHAPGQAIERHPIHPVPTTRDDPQPVEQQVTVADEVQPSFNEKAHLQQASIASAYPHSPPIEQHPAHFAPYAEDPSQQPVVYDAVVPAYSPRPQSPGPLPVKTNPEVSEQPPKNETIIIAPDANPLHSPQLPRFPPPIVTNAPHTPLPLPYHQPGQITHPNQVVKGGAWSHGLCECSNIGTCCLGSFCPCILYGRTQHRLSRKSRKEDPTNMLGYETCNGSCAAMALLCGCQWQHVAHAASSYKMRRNSRLGKRSAKELRKH
ncbi:DUF614 domain protein [Aspergillus clavatus NRRL 1]|uniref:DUF614 domain protein n=1 Tax=Aspergillus clavatus (strain ATCC 1007 / CBS 513.65 / DSM 816 / NCTC 3887 / NRRL 1 / QM 1276 / 107) TaxID=344612 RepID=A1CBQ8_ASPCL|nr:uncharacterized protein ACLA_016220 [Aspergillus clavatus NRRL 1]EAW13176.1 conserved hypothetical protein [Aspergillus clavatus NRRL 1]